MAGDVTEDRLNDLETRLAFQDDSLAKLSDALIGQQQRILQLEKTLELVIGQLNDLRQTDPEDEPPPHY